MGIKLKDGLKFKFVNEQRIEIVKKKDDVVIGHIFTPSGSGNNVENAIQICGFTEAFDLWGCGVFGEKVEVEKEYPDEQLKYLKDRFGAIANKKYKVQNLLMKKDIQLLFDDYEPIDSSFIRNKFDLTSTCLRCYSVPCHCEDKTDRDGCKMPFPFTVKKQIELEQTIFEHKKIEFIKKGDKKE